MRERWRERGGEREVERERWREREVERVSEGGRGKGTLGRGKKK